MGKMNPLDRLRYSLPKDIENGELVFSYNKPSEKVGQFKGGNPLTIFNGFSPSSDLYYGRTLIIKHPHFDGNIATPNVSAIDIFVGLINKSNRFYIGNKIINAFRSLDDLFVYGALLKDFKRGTYHAYFDLLQKLHDEAVK